MSERSRANAFDLSRHKKCEKNILCLRKNGISSSRGASEECEPSDWNGHFVIYFMSIFNDSSQEFADLLRANERPVSGGICFFRTEKAA
jgi:hypothetical protein